MTILLTISFIILLLLHLNLRSRVADLEQKQTTHQVSTATTTDQTDPTPPPLSPEFSITPNTPPPASNTQPTAATAPIKASATHSEPSFIVTWFKEQPLIKLGALFFFLGIAWFLGYAINEGWIHPALRILLAILVGIVVAGIGHLRRTVASTQYLTLTALGNAIIIASVATGQFTLEFLAPPLALTLLVLSIGYTVWVAIQTRTEWLAVVATVATLIAPLLVNAPGPDMQALLLFLLVASGVLTSVVAITQWRGVTATLAIGIGIYLINIHQETLVSDLVVWIYVLLFAGLFFVASSLSIMRTQDVRLVDITTLSVVGLWYLTLANELAFSPGIATLVAAFALASAGYVAQSKQLPVTVVAVFTVFAIAALLFGTAFLFSGMTLILVFIIEVTAVLTLACILRFSDRVLLLISCLYVLPVLLSLPYLNSPAWRDGIFHLPALTLAAVWIGLLWGTHQILNYNQAIKTALGHTLAGGLLVTSYVYGVLMLFSFGGGLGTYFNSPGVISTYTLLFAMTLLLVSYTIMRKLPHTWTTASLITLGLPLLLSLESLEITYWREYGLWHTHSIGIVLLAGLFMALLSILVITFQVTQLAYYRNAALALTGVGVLYGLLVIQAFWSGVFGDNQELTHVAVYTTYAVLIYSLITTAVKNHATPGMLTGLSVFGLLPILMALRSLSPSKWESSILHPDAAGLYVLSTLIILTGMTLLRYATSQQLLTQLQPLYRSVFAAAGLLGVGVIWVMSGAITPTEAGGATVALFIYTAAGLFCYLWGRAKGYEGLRWAGILLIALVTTRLILVDIWVMEVFWRIITFLGIGSLFIAAALLERQQPDKDVG